MTNGKIIKAVSWCFDYRHHLDPEDLPLVELLHGKWRKYGRRMYISGKQLEHLRRCYRKIPRRTDLAMKPRSKMITWYYFECKDCGYDSDEARKLVDALVVAKQPICPLCAGDTGRDVQLEFRKATSQEIEKHVTKET